MADKEDSIHIKIRIDVDEKDKQFVENLSQDIAKSDETRVTKKQKKQELIGPPTKDEFETRELEKRIKDINKKIRAKEKPKDLESLKKELKTKETALYLKQLREGHVGKIHNFTSTQFANLKQAATNPGVFILGAFTKKLGKVGGALAKGGLYGMIALIAYETFLFALDQFMQPGRWLDRRFKRIARLETMNFYQRTLQEELRHGYQEIRVTTMQGLRGGASQVNGNLFEFSSGATGILQSTPYRNSQQIYQSQNASGLTTDSQGNPRRRIVTAGWYG